MDKANIATVKGLNLPISTKASIEICNYIRYKQLNRARNELNLVLEKKLAIPLKRFHKDRGHRESIGPGFYPEKPTKEIIKLLNSIEANAQNKGLNTDSLILKKIIVNKASTPSHSGRNRGLMKRTHIEIEVHEAEPKTHRKETKPVKPKAESQKEIEK